jgi:outer membrane immunogenic protein
MKRLLTCVFALIGFAGAAAADGMPSTKDAAAPEASRWAGRYAGAYIGYADGRVTHFDQDGYNAFTGISVFSYDDATLIGGVTFGHNFPSGGLLVGVETEYGYLGFDDTRQHPGIAAIPRPASDSTGSFRAGFYSITSARLGVYSNRVLGYAKLGIAFVDVKATFTDTFPTGLTLVSGTKESAYKMGSTVGAGVELALSPQWSAKLEWDHIVLGDTDVVATASSGAVFRFSHDAVFDLLKLGVNFKF